MSTDFDSLLAQSGAARQAILGRVKTALKKSGDRTTAQNAAQFYLDQQQRGPLPILPADLVQRFIDWSIKMGSTVDRIATLGEAPTVIASYLQKHSLPTTGVCWPQYGDLAWASAGLSMAAREVQGGDKVGITTVTAGIAETGTILITPSPDTPTATVLLPETHIAIVPVGRIVATMEDAIDLVKRERGQVPRAMNFIAGPSRTADIEQTLVIGAHGPIRVHIVVLG